MAEDGYRNDLSPDERAIMALVKTAEIFRKSISPIFKKYGLTDSQYNVLRILDASEGGQNTMSNTSKILIVTAGNLTGIARRLERDGFLIRKAHENDERSKVLEITPKGRQTLKRISKKKDETLRKYLLDYSDDEKVQLRERLRAVRKRMRETD